MKGNSSSLKSCNNALRKKENNQNCKFEGSELSNETRSLKYNPISYNNCKNAGSNKENTKVTSLIKKLLKEQTVSLKNCNIAGGKKENNDYCKN